MHERRLARIKQVISTLLLFQEEENLVSKRDKCKNRLQRSKDSFETKRKRCFDGLYNIFSFLYQA